ncbi:MAG: undecaprenyldiphospho-muramoylpentapeptide beta-N-acetylglucosaminyltransferase [Pseudomonadota bacterium]|nr:undecaprenyldiphospho-muramoylpentapeptide beta-N-acetylglucosaminyltransferase [Pseudomonadota bacterium]
MILAGGTGGHVYPALAVARQLRDWGHEVVWMGTRKGLEARIVPASGIPIAWLSVSGLRGKGVLAWLLAPAQLAIAISQALSIVWRLKPRAVLGMGGFVAGPGALVSLALGKPLVIHEQNALAGLTNRWLAPFASRVLMGFPNTFAREDAIFIGNPVRREIAAIPPPEQRLADRRGRLRLLVLGGSLGAKRLNDVLPETLARVPLPQRPEVWHQAGGGLIDAAIRSYRTVGVEARIDAFIEDMAAAYAWCDLVICRAGALTIAELAAAGAGAILVPYPHAVDDHQSANARFLTEAGAALAVRNEELDASRLTRLLEPFLSGGVDRTRLQEMARAARRKGCLDAVEQAARSCLEVAALSAACRNERPS